MMVYSAIKGAVPFIGGVTLHWPAWLASRSLNHSPEAVWINPPSPTLTTQEITL